MFISNKPFESITYEDIEGLVRARTPENQILEYKRVFDSDKAAKIISSMANTYGGLIIYGIRTNQQTNLPESIDRVVDNKLDDTVNSICIDNINPYIDCASGYLGSDDKRVFIIKVPESDRTPHAIEDNTGVYIRFNSQTRTIERAQLDQIDWLKAKRAKSELLRSQLERSARERVSIMMSPIANEFYRIAFWCCPQFAREKLIEATKIDNSIRSIFAEVNSPLFGYAYFQTTNINNGVAKTSRGKQYLEFTSFGSMFAEIRQPYFENSEQRKMLEIVSVTKRLMSLSAIAYSWFQQIGFVGTVNLGMSIFHIRNSEMRLDFPGVDADSGLSTFKCVIDDETDMTSVISLDALKKPDFLALKEFLSQLLHLYNVRGVGVERVLRDSAAVLRWTEEERA